MKNYLRTLSASCLLILGLSAGTAAAHQTATDTSTAAKKHRKAKDTSSTAAASNTASTSNRRRENQGRCLYAHRQRLGR